MTSQSRRTRHERKETAHVAVAQEDEAVPAVAEAEVVVDSEGEAEDVGSNREAVIEWIQIKRMGLNIGQGVGLLYKSPCAVLMDLGRVLLQDLVFEDLTPHRTSHV